MYITLDRDYEIKCTLGTIRDIEKRFGKGFYEMMRNIETMTVGDQIKMLYAGVKKSNPDLTELSFSDLCDDYLGVGDLQDILESYLYQLQYPGLNEDEIKSKIQKKITAAKNAESHASLGTR